ncbi:MAG: hypothetical protein GY917_13695 [Planctomycetaceae bacterium]|nr:hypothetical protein [Planctomycetaceae bacterium]
MIVAHFFNDLDEILHTMMYGLQKPMFTMQGDELFINNYPVPRPNLRNTSKVQTTNPLTLTKRLLESMQARCAAQDCQLLLMQFGAFASPERDETIRLRALITKAFPTIENISYLDLDREFAAAELTAEELIGKNKDNHWDAHGHQKTAEILYRFLQDNQLLIAE